MVQDSFQIRCRIAEQYKTTIYTSSPSYTPFGLKPATKTLGLMRARCPSEITTVSYLFWFPDQAREVLIFASKQCGHHFHTVCCQIYMLSKKLQVGGSPLVYLPQPTTALSSCFPTGLTKSQSNASIYPSFLYYHLVFILGLRVPGCDRVHPTKCSFDLGHQNSLLGICSGRCASTR